MDKVSFVVTSYDYEQFIEETLNSIKNQSFQDFEIIVVDDFSTDNSVKKINTFINNNPNLEVKVDSSEYSDFEIQKLNWYSSNFKKTNEEFILLKPKDFLEQ